MHGEFAAVSSLAVAFASHCNPFFTGVISFHFVVKVSDFYYKNVTISIFFHFLSVPLCSFKIVGVFPRISFIFLFYYSDLLINFLLKYCWADEIINTCFGSIKSNQGPTVPISFKKASPDWKLADKFNDDNYRQK